MPAPLPVDTPILPPPPQQPLPTPLRATDIRSDLLRIECKAKQCVLMRQTAMPLYCSSPSLAATIPPHPSDHPFHTHAAESSLQHPPLCILRGEEVRGFHEMNTQIVANYHCGGSPTNGALWWRRRGCLGEARA
ncbi:hypothetical protein E2C01_053831 [Portunus trituberculatus]|uniref:Uncharacterized protein n=1 Tax=Portunus trituberculatus TaxID=210409 RepID=A0A5B7GTB6_PORTR|nr:hypothetical protein [Portunus trituberculatus]